MPISAEHIQAIRERAEITRVIGTYVELKKKGQRHVGLCPFHAEKTPSFSVSADKGLYYCFGCHAGGDVFSFLMRHQGLAFNAAVRQLATDVGVELEPESEADRRRRKREAELVQANEYAQAFFEHTLKADAGQTTRAYLRQRGIPEDLARERRLGSGGRSDDLLGYLKSKRVPVELATEAGFVTQDGRRSLFDGRLTFPIFDANRRLVGFGGRRLHEDSSPKYINSSDSPVFAKRRLVYGWEVAQDAMRRAGRVVVVEGYADVLACQRAGIHEAVASLGTAFTAEHAAACARLAKEAVVLFDADAAGQRASLQVVERLLGAGLRARVATLPAGEDPDSLLRERGPEALQERLKAAAPALEAFMEAAFAGDALSIEERAAAATELGPLLAALPSGIERELYTNRLAERVGVSVEQLQDHLRATAARRPKPKPSPSETQPEPASEPEAEAAPQPTRLELEALRELLLYPDLRARFAELSEYASDPMRLLLDELAESQAAVEEVLAHHVRNPREVGRLAAVSPPSEGTEDELRERGERTLMDVLNRLKEGHIRKTRKQILQDLIEAEAQGERADDLVRRVQNLTRQEKELRRPGSTE